MADHRPRPSLTPALRRLEDDAVLQGVPAGARHRVAERLAEEAARRETTSSRRPWVPALAFAAGAALVMLVIGLGVRSHSWPSEPVARSRQLGAFALAGDTCTQGSDPAPSVWRLHGQCRLTSAAMVAQTWDASRVRAEGSTLRVVDGTVVFEVGKVGPEGDPVSVFVSHGRIDVLGTRFSVDQGSTGGHVDLFEGCIRFVGDDGTTHEVSPGQRLGWGDRAADTSHERPAAGRGASRVGEAASSPGVADPATKPAPDPTPQAATLGPAARGSKRGTPSQHPDEDATPVIERVEKMRREGRFAAAADELRRALQQRWSSRTAEVLSFELGEILERHLGDADAACRHWQSHRARFARGRYAAAVATALRQCEDASARGRGDAEPP